MSCSTDISCAVAVPEGNASCSLMILNLFCQRTLGVRKMFTYNLFSDWRRKKDTEMPVK